MLTNYFLVAWRQLRKYPVYSSITVASLALGLACAVAVFLFAEKEYSINRQFSNVENLYRISSHWKEPGMGYEVTTLAPIGPLLADSSPDVIATNRSWGGSVVVNVDSAAFRETMLICEPNYFEMFDFPFTVGTATGALNNPNSVVLTDELALKYFGKSDVVGETIILQTWTDNAKLTLKITGVIKKPGKSSVPYPYEEDYGLYISTADLKSFLDPRSFESWGSRNIPTFVQLRDGADPKKTDEKLQDLLTTHCPESIRENVSLILDPLAEVYLNDSNGQARRLLQGLFMFAGLMIGIAAINYINLSTARSMQRSREIGLRKIIGAAKKALAGQFMAEALLSAVLAMLVGITMIFVLQKATNINGLPQIDLSMLFTTKGFVMFASLSILTCVLAGCYPAFVLSSFDPLAGARGRFSSGRSAAWVRKGLVVLQFGAAIFLFIASLTISRQLDLLLSRNLGFNKEQVLIIESVPRVWTYEGLQQQDRLKEAMRSLPSVKHASIAFDVPGSMGSGTVELHSPQQGNSDSIALTQFIVDEDYLKTFGLSLIDGRFYSRQFPRREGITSLVINQGAMKALGLENGVGDEVVTAKGRRYTIVGIVKDFGFLPLDRDNKPLALVYVHGRPFYRYLALSLVTENYAQAITDIEEVWKQLHPDVPFEYRFMDDVVARKFEQIENAKVIAQYAMLLSVFVACLGIWGLASFSTERRAREIGIRKVLGASVAHVVHLVTREFIVLVLIANILVWPIAYFAMNRWLENYVHRIEFQFGVYLLAIAFGLMTTLLAISGQTIKTALTSPAEVLRCD